MFSPSLEEKSRWHIYAAYGIDVISFVSSGLADKSAQGEHHSREIG
jgi:hypothetical protein